VIDEVRGEGLLIGLHVVQPNTEVIAALRETGMLVLPAGENVVRLLPPLNVTEAEIDIAIGLIETALARVEAKAAAGTAAA
jgi:acetylornithine/N-succinyldiaminopimelate aminotransferase